jgi:hypothetical protein
MNGEGCDSACRHARQTALLGGPNLGEVSYGDCKSDQDLAEN